MTDEAGEGTNGKDVPAPLDTRRLVVSTIIAMIVFTGVVGVLAWFFREPLLEVGHWFVDNFGGPGVAVGYFLPDAFTIPLPNDAFTAFGLWGGMPFWEVVAWGSLGSIAGGSRTGRWFLALAAVSPIPYSITCWACGVTQMPYGEFVVISLLRIPRVAVFLWLIQQGFVHIVG
jgi:membrane protein YqaA with SNARE-associated domain